MPQPPNPSEQEALLRILEQQYRALRIVTFVIIGFSCGILGYIAFGDAINLASLRKAEVPPSSEAPIAQNEPPSVEEEVENGIHVPTGLVYAEGFDVVRATCTACHSAQLVTQNRASREGWANMIDWMQETQGLWDLGEQEPIILDYLATYYAPEEVGRRANLDVEAIEWYVLEEN